jgi:hypothetical protein
LGPGPTHAHLPPAYASAQYNDLKAFDSFSAVVEPGRIVSSSVFSEAAFADMLEILGTGTGFVTVTGFVDGTGPPNVAVLAVGVGNSANNSWVCTVQNADNTGTCTATVPVTFGQYFFLDEELLVSMAPIIDNSASSLSGAGTFTADFLDTAGISNLEVFDANMNPLVAANVISISGTDYSAAPEPSSLSLLSVTTVVFAWLLRRRSIFPKGLVQSLRAR